MQTSIKPCFQAYHNTSLNIIDNRCTSIQVAHRLVHTCYNIHISKKEVCTTMKLSDSKIKNTKPGKKIIHLNDGDGLWMEVRPVGSKLWRYRFTFKGKRTRLSLGEYPAVSLKVAREKRDELKTLIVQGINPRTTKETPKDETQAFVSFGDMVKKYLDHYRADRNEKYWQGVESLFKRDVLPIIGKLPIEEINSKQIVTIVQAVQGRGAVESARRLFTQLGKVFKFSIAYGECTRNPCGDIERSMVLQKPTGRNYNVPTKTNHLIQHSY